MRAGLRDCCRRLRRPILLRSSLTRSVHLSNFEDDLTMYLSTKIRTRRRWPTTFTRCARAREHERLAWLASPSYSLVLYQSLLSF